MTISIAMLLVAHSYQDALAQDCVEGQTNLVASATSVSRFSLALGGRTACGGTPSASQQLLAYELQTPVETIGSAGTAFSQQTVRRGRDTPRVRPTPTQYRDLIVAAARRHDIDPDLLQAIMSVESSSNARALSPVGARGLMQVMPATGARFGVTDPAGLYEPEINLHAASAYLKTLQGLFGNDLTLVLAAYNAGEGAVQKHGRQVPPYRETQAYVRNVLARYDQFLQARRASIR
ncbi:MAG: lytic transglycosylase domain-containing protein [Brevundimonas sp.]